MQNKVSGVPSPTRVIDSLWSASLLAFTGGSLNVFLYLNHGQVFAGVMTGNVVLLGIALSDRVSGGATHYLRPLLAYICGIWLIAMLQRRVPHHFVRLALSIVIVGLLVMSFLPATFPDEVYIFLVVLLTGFLVGTARRVHTYSYNATVLTGSLRDATISLYKAYTLGAADDLRKSRDLWLVMFSFLAGAAAGGAVGRHIGNHALWLPVGMLVIVLAMVLWGASRTSQTRKL